MYYGALFPLTRSGAFPYPSHSPDFTATDPYIWRMLKESAWSDEPPSSVSELRENIQTVFPLVAAICVKHVQQSAETI